MRLRRNAAMPSRAGFSLFFGSNDAMATAFSAHPSIRAKNEARGNRSPLSNAHADWVDAAGKQGVEKPMSQNSE
jgi:hypothetical protein